MNDYYKTLGVAKEASAEEIKKAYRKLAHQHHPDKAGKGNEARFKEINEAYQVLSDPEKRQRYDQYGSADFGGGGGGQGAGGFEDLFRGFGGQGQSASFGGGFGGVFDELFGAALSQLQVQVEVRLTQALLGETLHFEVQGEKIELRMPPGTQDGTAFQFRGKGGHYRGGRGDLIVVVKVKYPSRISGEQKRLLEELQRTGL